MPKPAAHAPPQCLRASSPRREFAAQPQVWWWGTPPPPFAVLRRPIAGTKQGRLNLRISMPPRCGMISTLLLVKKSMPSIKSKSSIGKTVMLQHPRHEPTSNVASAWPKDSISSEFTGFTRQGLESATMPNLRAAPWLTKLCIAPMSTKALTVLPLTRALMCIKHWLCVRAVKVPIACSGDNLTTGPSSELSDALSSWVLMEAAAITFLGHLPCIEMS